MVRTHQTFKLPAGRIAAFVQTSPGQWIPDRSLLHHIETDLAWEVICRVFYDIPGLPDKPFPGQQRRVSQWFSVKNEQEMREIGKEIGLRQAKGIFEYRLRGLGHEEVPPEFTEMELVLPPPELRSSHQNPIKSE